jgi:hypothetical protein
MKSAKTLTIIMVALLVVSAILVISLLANVSDNKQDPTMGNWINTNLVWAYILLALAVGIIIIFSLYNMVSETKSLKAGLMVIAFFVVIGGFSYIISSSAIPQFLGSANFVAKGILTPNVSRWISTGLNVTYILFLIAIGSIVLSSVSRLFK